MMANEGRHDIEDRGWMGDAVKNEGENLYDPSNSYRSCGWVDLLQTHQIFNTAPGPNPSLFT